MGRITAKPHETDIDVTVGGYHFKTHLTDEVPIDFKAPRLETFHDIQTRPWSSAHACLTTPLQILWNEKQSEAGPEGWARKVPLFPTHWYVYSLGSKATYQLSNPEAGINQEGRGYAHQEKNWGETFPAGHVWVQAMSLKNDAQVQSGSLRSFQSHFQ